MKFFYVFAIIFSFVFITTTQAQWNSPNRYKSKVFSADQIDNKLNLVYTQVIDIRGVNMSLNLDVFYPKLSDDSIKKRPLIVMVHGGGFMIGGKNDPLIYLPTGARNSYDQMAAQWASMGYVVATINYRLYNNTSVYGSAAAQGFINHFRKDKQQNVSAASALFWYVAMQDLNAAIKYLCYNGQSFGIDPQQVFLFGESAGAVTTSTFAVSYKQQDEINQYYDFVNYSNVGDLNYSTRPEYRSQAYTIRSVASVSGLIADKRLFTQEDAMPFFMEHNMFDGVVSPIMDTRLIHSMGSQRIMERIRGWGSNGKLYPCSNFYYTWDSTYDYITEEGALHTLSGNPLGWAYFKELMADFNANIIKNTGVCAKDKALYQCNLYSSNAKGVRVEQQETSEVNRLVLGVYPMPASQEVTFTGLTESATTSVTIYDAQGTLVKTAILHTASGEITLSIEDLKPGIYSVLLKDDVQQNRQVKIIKQ